MSGLHVRGRLRGTWPCGVPEGGAGCLGDGDTVVVGVRQLTVIRGGKETRELCRLCLLGGKEKPELCATAPSPGKENLKLCEVRTRGGKVFLEL